MRKVGKENLSETPYQRKGRFDRRHTIFAWLTGTTVGAALLDGVVLGIKVLPEGIDKAITTESQGLFTLENNSLAVGFAVLGTTAVIGFIQTSYYKSMRAAVEGEITAYELRQPEKTNKSEQQQTDTLIDS